MKSVKTPDELQTHMLGTYRSLRIGLFLIGWVLPFVLWWSGILLYRLELQSSMSAYYHAGNGALRDWLVGSLCTIGVLLLVYKGFTTGENRALNVAGVLAVGVALFPMPWSNYNAVPFPWLGFKTLHNFCAITFFIIIGCVCIFAAPATLHLVPNTTLRKSFRTFYSILGVLMFALPVGVIFAGKLTRFESAVFWTEATGVWVFAAYWLTKSIEMEITQADRKAAKGKLAVHEPEGNAVQRTLRPARVAEADEKNDRPD